MIGDNPAADIRGANAAEGPWRSILVRTGPSATKLPDLPLPVMHAPCYIYIYILCEAPDAGEGL